MEEKPKYKGLGETAAAFGQSQMDGMVGGLAGIAAGAAVGAGVHNKGKMEAIRDANKTQKAADAFSKLEKEGQGWNAERVSEEALETAERVLKENTGLKKYWHEMGRGGKAFVGAMAGMLALSTIAQMTGYFRGISKAKAARQQFDDLVGENQALTQKLASAEALMTQNKSFVEGLQAERAEAKTQAPTRA